MDLWSVLAIACFVTLRLGYVIGVGVALHRQDREKVFTRVAGIEPGFRRFQRSASLVMNGDGLAFVILCIVTRQTLHTSVAPVVLIVVGVVLSVIGVGVKLWAAARLGMAGYYWKNFFEPTEFVPLDPPGPYRYLDNPMYTVGYLQTYGLALVCGSLPGLIASAFAQIGVLVFHYTVEKPHFDRLLAATRGA